MRPCLQIHIPRTSGTSQTHALGLQKRYDYEEDFKHLYTDQPIATCLENMSIGHILLRTIYNIQPYLYLSFIFTFVRNPYDRMTSLFHHLSRHIDKNLNFLGFCKEVLKLWEQKEIAPVGPYNRLDFSQLNPQVDWILEIDGTIKVHFIGRYEHLDTDFFILCRLLNIEPRKLPHKHKSKYRTSYLDYYKMFPQCIDIVNTLYEDDFLYLNYPFMDKP